MLPFNIRTKIDVASCVRILARRQLPPVVTLPFVVSYGQIDIAVGAAVVLLGLSVFVIAGMNLVSMVVPYCLASLFVLILQVRVGCKL